jgi:hypothetical protein
MTPSTSSSALPQNDLVQAETAKGRSLTPLSPALAYGLATIGSLAVWGGILMLLVRLMG